ncbi:MAG: hypothetical protein JXA94_03980 [Parachlamydiales bacterium]|nr:hypothetical protein [Parachlamydiales bacterium]
MKVELSLNKYFSDRLEYAFNNLFKVSNSLFLYFLNVLYIAPDSYTKANRKAIDIFKHFLIQRVGKQRLDRISDKMKVNLDYLQNNSWPLRSRDVVKLLDAFKDLNVSEIQEFIDKVKSDEIKDPILDKKILNKIKRVKKFDELDSKTCEILVEYLSNPMKDLFNYTPKRPDFVTRFLAMFVFDFPLLLHEKVFLCSENELLSKEGFYESLCKRFARLEMNVGSIIPAYKDSGGYYRIAAKLITGDGLVSYTLLALTKDMKLPALRLFKGTGMEFSSIDFLSYLITNFEKDLGKRAFKSGLKYEKFLKPLGRVKTELGHSLGGTIVEYRSAHFDHIENVYLFNAPGVPYYVIDRFNKKYEKKPFNIFIRKSQGDFIENAGPYHLGYQAPEAVNINFIKFVKQEDDGEIIHNTTFLDPIKKMYAITGGDLDYELNNYKRSLLEPFRMIFGGFLLSPFIRFLRYIKRVSFNSRADQEQGLYIEDMNNKKTYKIRHIKKGRTFVDLSNS